MTTPKFCLALGLIMAVLTIAPNLYAHEGHDDTSAFTGAEGIADAPLTLSDESIANLDVQTKAAELKTLSETVDIPATVTLIPEKRAVITTRFNGLVKEINVRVTPLIFWMFGQKTIQKLIPQSFNQPQRSNL